VSPVIATVPARAEFVHVLRTVVAAVAARLDLPYDALDDLRMAVDARLSSGYVRLPEP
jgi:anti-sigma regulatory factor (Ser/Thr protein kinase)